MMTLIFLNTDFKIFFFVGRFYILPKEAFEHFCRVFEMQWAEVPSMEVAKLARPISLVHGVVKEMTGWRLLKVRQRTGLAWYTDGSHYELFGIQMHSYELYVVVNLSIPFRFIWLQLPA